MSEEEPFIINDRQRTLFDRLSEKSEALANMYLGALYALRDRNNPDSIPQAAHSLREMIEKFPTIVDLTTSSGPGLKDKARRLSASFSKASSSSCYTDGEWSGEIDNSLKRFLSRCGEFFEWFATNDATRRELARKTIESVSSSLPLPGPIQDLEAQKWLLYRDYFVGIAHHSSSNTDEFEGYLFGLEDFIFHMLQPKTYENMDEIDEILEGGPE